MKEKKYFTLIHIDKGYADLLANIKTRLYRAQMKAAISVNHELLRFYWEVGTLIIDQQQRSAWGDKLFETLSSDLNSSFPNSKGFSKTNLKNMKTFASHYPQGEFGQALPDQLTWTHHVVLIQMFEPEELHIKIWYAQKTVEMGWSYRELKEGIQSNLYERQSDKTLKTTNFQDKLPVPTSYLAQEMIKEPYKFHFLTLGEDAHEKEIHLGLLSHTKQFLMELGQGFALYGTHYPIMISNRRFELDILMYHT